MGFFYLFTWVVVVFGCVFVFFIAFMWFLVFGYFVSFGLRFGKVMIIVMIFYFLEIYFCVWCIVFKFVLGGVYVRERFDVFLGEYI